MGWSIFAVEWALAIAGVVFKSFAVQKFAVASALVYLFQGWFGVFAVRLLAHAIGWDGVLWLAAGGLAYTLGIVFFALDRIALLSRRLASLCARRKHRPLLCHSLLCSPAPKLNASSCVRTAAGKNSANAGQRNSVRDVLACRWAFPYRRGDEEWL